MSRILALEWDDFELRYILASPGNNRSKLIAAGSCALEHPSGKDEEQTTTGDDDQEIQDDNKNGDDNLPDISETIKNALKGQKLSKVTTLINVKRSDVEFLQIELPPVDDKELPAMVRNQAMLESPSISDESVIDFQSLKIDPGLPRNVMVAAISEVNLSKIQSSLVLAGLTSKKFCLRNFSTASLAKKLIEDMPETAIVINCVHREVDILLLQAGELSQMRNIRLAYHSDDERNHKQILRELKRMTMMSPKSSAEDEETDNIYLFGKEYDYNGLKDYLERELDQTVQLIDPFFRMKAAPDLLPEDSGQFASLISLVMEEAKEEAPAIDFLNPKKPPKPPNKQRQYLTYAAVAMAVLGSGFFLYSETLGQLNSDINRLKATKKERDKQAKTISKQKATMASIRDWEKGDVNWLDELRDLSIRFPNAQDILIHRLSLSSSKKGGGSISLNGLARSPSVVELMEQNIRDDYHQIRTPRVREQLKDKEYSWHFDTTVAIRKRKKEQYISHIPEHLRPVQEEEKSDKKKSGESKSQPIRKTAKASKNKKTVSTENKTNKQVQK
jgi:Tfp pilus assembly PilM family ATPase